MKKKNPIVELSPLSTKEAAKILGVHSVTVVRLVNSGKLLGRKKTDGRNSPMLVDAQSVRDYAERIGVSSTVA